MARKKKSNSAPVGSDFIFVEEIPARTRRPKYMDVVEKLATRPGKPALIMEAASPSSANSLMQSLRTSANRMDGSFEFHTRTVDGKINVYGVCAER